MSATFNRPKAEPTRMSVRLKKRKPGSAQMSARQPKPESAQGSSVFKRPTAKSAQGSSVFKRPTAESAQGSSVFKRPTPESAQGSSVFKRPTPESAQGSSVFKRPTPESAQVSSVFNWSSIFKKPTPESAQGSSVFKGPTPESAQVSSVFKWPSVFKKPKPESAPVYHKFSRPNAVPSPMLPRLSRPNAVSSPMLSRFIRSQGRRALVCPRFSRPNAVSSPMLSRFIRTQGGRAPMSVRLRRSLREPQLPRIIVRKAVRGRARVRRPKKKFDDISTILNWPKADPSLKIDNSTTIFGTPMAVLEQKLEDNLTILGIPKAGPMWMVDDVTFGPEQSIYKNIVDRGMDINMSLFKFTEDSVHWLLEADKNKKLYEDLEVFFSRPPHFPEVYRRAMSKIARKADIVKDATDMYIGTFPDGRLTKAQFIEFCKAFRDAFMDGEVTPETWVRFVILLMHWDCFSWGRWEGRNATEDILFICYDTIRLMRAAGHLTVEFLVDMEKFLVLQNRRLDLPKPPSIFIPYHRPDKL